MNLISLSRLLWSLLERRKDAIERPFLFDSLSLSLSQSRPQPLLLVPSEHDICIWEVDDRFEESLSKNGVR